MACFFKATRFVLEMGASRYEIYVTVAMKSSFTTVQKLYHFFFSVANYAGDEVAPVFFRQDAGNPCQKGGLFITSMCNSMENLGLCKAEILETVQSALY